MPPEAQGRHLIKTAQTQSYRFMDEVDAVSMANDWLDQMVKDRGLWQIGYMPPGVQITRDGMKGEGGGVLTLWVDKRPACMAVLLRDLMNFTVLTTIEILNP